MEVMHQIVVFIFLAMHGTIALQTVHYTETEPRFAEPVPDITVSAGSNVTIPCEVESLGEKYAVSWMYLDKNQLLTYKNLTITRDPRFSITVSDNHIFSLQIQNVRMNDTGRYFCQLNTEPVQSSVGFLQVVEAEPFLFTHSHDIIVTAGYDATFLCEVDSLRENNTVTWKHFGRNGNLTIGNRKLTRDPRISITVSDNRNFTLKIRDIQIADSGRYMCTLNTIPVQSKVGYLEVCFMEFENPDRLVEAVVGETVILRCNLKSHPKPEVSWRREGEESAIVSNSKYEIGVFQMGQKVQMTLIIKNVKPEDFGSYLCSADNDWNWKRGNVTLYEKEPWFAEAVPNITVVAGSDVTIPCVVESLRENFQVVWMHLDKQLLLTFNDRTHIADPRISLTIRNNRVFSLRIQKVQMEDSGRLACQIYTDPMQSSVGFLQVVEQSDPNAAVYTPREDSTEGSKSTDRSKITDEMPPKISVPNCLVGGDIGDYVTLRCNLKSNPNSLTHWKLEREGVMAYPNMKLKSSIIDKGDNKVQMKLSIQILSPHAFGIYTCFAKNSLGEAEGHILLHNLSEPQSSICPSSEGAVRSTAQSPPNIQIPITLLAAFVLDNATLVCNVDSNPEPIATWTLGNDEIIISNAKYDTSLINNGVNKKQMRLTIKNVKPEDFGIYKCIARNSLGEAVGEITMFEQFLYPFMEPSRHELTEALTNDG